MWISDCMRAGAPNLHIVQGQTVYYILCFDLSSHLDSQCLEGRNQVETVLGIFNFIYQGTSGSK